MISSFVEESSFTIYHLRPPSGKKYSKGENHENKYYLRNYEVSYV